MSQQAAAWQGAGHGGRRKPGYLPQKGGTEASTTPYKTTIAKIAQDRFCMVQNKCAAQFTQSCKNVANYLKRTLAAEGYLVTEKV